MKDLSADKKRVVTEHLDQMMEAHSKMMKLVDDAMRDAEIKGSGNLDIFNRLKLSLSFDKSKLLKIRPEDMLQYSKSWFDATQQNFKIVMDISKEEYSSLIKQLDQQFDIAKRELELIDQELLNVNDDSKKSWLQWKRDEVVNREWGS